MHCSGKGVVSCDGAGVVDCGDESEAQCSNKRVAHYSYTDSTLRQRHTAALKEWYMAGLNKLHAVKQWKW